MPTTWKLRYRLLTEDAQHTCRHHLTTLQHDANVYSVTFTRDLGQDHAILDVIFNDGVDQPATPELQSLDRRYPADGTVFFARPEDYAMVGASPEGIQRTTLFLSSMRSGRAQRLFEQFYTDQHVAAAIDLHASFPLSSVSMGTSVSLSHEFGVSEWRQKVPAWVHPFVYAKEPATGVIIQIEGVVPCPEVSSGFILAKLCQDPGMKVAILVDFFVENYVETEKPVVGLTWHEHLLADDGV